MITPNTTFKEIKEIENLNKVFPYLIGNGEAMLTPDKTLNDLQSASPTWSAVDMAYGLQRLKEIADTNETYLYDVYSKEEISQEPGKAQVKLIYFPAPDSKKFVILAAGGAYGAVCSLVEAFPVAARLNELGITVFCLNYRVGPPKLLPKPMEDLAAAYKFISKYSELFQVDPEHYGVGGFSAGGHLAGAWGTKELGFRKYEVPAPEILLLGYPFLAMWRTLQPMPKEISKQMLTGYFGEDYSEEICKVYNIDENVDEKYPAVYLVHAEDDTTVPIWNSKDMVKALRSNRIACQMEAPKTGEHGFGLGSDCEAAGWVERAVVFWDSL